MPRFLGLISLLPLLMLTTPASAVTAEQKMETCKFGADSQKLAGAKRKAFISRCMAEEKSQKTANTPAAKTNTDAKPNTTSASASPPRQQ